MNDFPLYLGLESNYQGTILMHYSFQKVIVKFCGLQYVKGFNFCCNPQNLKSIKNLTLQMCLVHRIDPQLFPKFQPYSKIISKVIAKKRKKSKFRERKNVTLFLNLFDYVLKVFGQQNYCV